MVKPGTKFLPPALVAARARGSALVGLSLLFLGCQNYSGQLLRAQSYYQESQYDQALAVFRHLEPDLSGLEARERVRYYYLRGMTDLRLGFSDDARYWLSLSKASSSGLANALTPEESTRLDETLSELNKEHYARVRSGTVGQTTPAEQKACEWSSECDEGFVCKSGLCTAL